MSATRLILASRSPRRAALLREAGFVFEQADPPFADPRNPGDARNAGQRDAEALTAELATRKARSLFDSLELRDGERAVLLAADTISASPTGELLGQPASREEARAMLEAFIDASHPVVTGVALLDTATGEVDAFADTAIVTLGHVDGATVDAYLDSEQWRGKAGGYNLGDLWDGWPFSVRGDMTTVIGLPMDRLAPKLARLGVVSGTRADQR